MARQSGLFDVEGRLRELSAKGDDLERVNADDEYHEIKQSDKIERDHYQLGAHSRPRVPQQVD